jgi:diacylglycerol O-acyltransferase / trehalose O-mycolyltransferase
VTARLVRAALALATGLSLILALSPASASTIGACPASRCRSYHVPAPPGVRITNDQVEVILPVGYSTSHRRYPVIYLFNGAWGPYNEWIVHTDIGTYSARFPAIFVDMDAGDLPRTGFFSDWYDHSYQWETWHIHTVMPWVNRHFRTVKGDNAAIGVSLGGTGALDYAEHNPGLFKAVASLSGWVDTQFLTPASGYDTSQSYPTITRAWGDQTLNADVWAAHNPTADVANLRGTVLYVACGTGSPDPTSADIHGPQQEADLWSSHFTFMSAVEAMGIEHHDRFYAGGAHNWTYFIPDLHWALPQLMHNLH